MDIQALALVNKGTSAGRQVQDLFLGNFPNSLIQGTNLGRDLRDILHTAVELDQLILNGRVPKVQSNQIFDQMFVNDHKLPT